MTYTFATQFLSANPKDDVKTRKDSKCTTGAL